MICTLASRKNLQGQKSPRRTILLTLESRNIMGYQPGDHLVIFPQNDEKMVSRLFKRLQLDMNSTVPIKLELLDDKTGNWKTMEKLPSVCFKTMFMHFLDITTPPTQAHLKLFSKLATDPEEQNQLMFLNKVFYQAAILKL